MPTVLRQEGFEVVIRTDDHDPPHVHVWRAGTTVKVDLQRLVVEGRKGMSNQDAGRAVRLVREHVTFLLAKWEEFHG